MFAIRRYLTSVRVPIGIPQLALATLVLQNTFLILFMRYSRTIQGPLYASSTAVVSMEVLKLLSCLLVLCFIPNQYDENIMHNLPTNVNNGHSISKLHWFSISRLCYGLKTEVIANPRELALLSIPSVLYTIQNNLLYYALSHLDAATFQVGYQLKILTTALFSVAILNRRLSSLQWSSLVLLTIGVSLAQLSAHQSSDSKHNTVYGFIAVLLAALTSGFAGVYFEKILKGSTTSLWMRNVQMGLSSIILGFVGVYLSDDRTIVLENGFFYGYSWVVVTVILLQAIGGLVVAVVVKYADNILKGFAASFSIVSSCTLSYFFLDFNPTYMFLVGAFIVNLSMYLYSQQPAPKKNDDQLFTSSPTKPSISSTAS